MALLAHSEARLLSKCERSLLRMLACRARKIPRSPRLGGMQPLQLDTKMVQDRLSHVRSVLRSEPRGDRPLARMPVCTLRKIPRSLYPPHNHHRLPDTRKLEGREHLGHSVLRSESRAYRLLPRKLQCTAGRSRRRRCLLHRHPRLVDTQQAADTPRLGHSVPPSPPRICCLPVHTRWCKPPRFRHSRRLVAAPSASRGVAEKHPPDVQ